MTKTAKTATKTVHIRVDTAELEAIDALAQSVQLDRSTVGRLLLRAGLRIAERDPRDLLVPSTPSSTG